MAILTNSATSSPAQALAERVAAKMFAADAASQALGMRIVAVRPGYSSVEMDIRPDMLNGHATCHGGIIFTLADSALAFACNSRNFTTVAAGCSIEFLHPCHLGDKLVAEATEISLQGKTGLYDITVTNQHGRCVALFRGRSHRIQGEVVIPDDSSHRVV